MANVSTRAGGADRSRNSGSRRELWDQALLEAFSRLGDVERTPEGLRVGLVDGGGARREVQVLVRERDWVDYVALQWGEDAVAATHLAEAVRGSESTVRALIVCHDHSFVLSPYVPPWRP